MKDTITMRQAGILLLLCIFSNKILLLPSLMFEHVKADAIFSLILLFLVELLCLPILISLKKKFPNQKLYDIMKKYITVLGAKLIYLILILFMLFKALLTFSIVYVYFKQQIYQDEFIWIVLIAFIPVINHAVLTGLKSTTRTMEILLGVVLTGFVFCLAISLFTPISTPIFFVSSAKEIFASVYKYAFTFGDFIIMFLVIDKIDFKQKEEKKLYFYSSMGMLLVILLFFLFYSKYQITAFMHNNALADLLVFSVQFNAIGRLDIIAMLTIMTITLFQMEIFCYAFCNCFLNLFPLLNDKYAVVVFDILFLILYYIFVGKYEIMVNSTVGWLAIVGAIVSYLIPLICFIISLFKRREYEKSG